MRRDGKQARALAGRECLEIIVPVLPAFTLEDRTLSLTLMRRVGGQDMAHHSDKALSSLPLAGPSCAPWRAVWTPTAAARSRPCRTCSR